MTAAFIARDGFVYFEGHPLSEEKAVALRHRLTSEAIAPQTEAKTATALWAARGVLADAIGKARAQRRATPVSPEVVRFQLRPRFTDNPPPTAA